MKKYLFIYLFIMIFLGANCQCCIDNSSIYDNLSYDKGVCSKDLEVTFLSLGKNPLNGQFSDGLSLVFKSPNDIPTSSMSFLYNSKEYYISIDNKCNLKKINEGDKIVIHILFYEFVKEPYEYEQPYSLIVAIDNDIKHEM